jgi:hypothetical protein
MQNLPPMPILRVRAGPATCYRAGGGSSRVVPHYISYRNTGPRQESMVTIYEMTGGYAASRGGAGGWTHKNAVSSKPCPAHRAGFPFVWLG